MCISTCGGFARLVLDDFWQGASNTDRRKFTTVLRGFMERTYSDRFTRDSKVMYDDFRSYRQRNNGDLPNHIRQMRAKLNAEKPG